MGVPQHRLAELFILQKAGRDKVLILNMINSLCEVAGVFQTASVLHSQFTVTLNIQPGLGF